ncbi:DUF2231 domain-containing protein [Rhizobium sp. SSA_523]|uniref:DUF2231 domain-containing protein n=1 Tax=Rhizobium sp. SSA_523 TaxID=2952477 RepID=UPI002091ABB1|nr:DUF2231 domain-containing protein [Rhizobium sp. SSA_523]MCO5730022.1 DUF2231 domain-containing protein [Rhizobium sp. SSA_523]WKC25092.1 DUF2231 domain-containing protein [Rhizobium sp. SSA_523]
MTPDQPRQIRAPAYPLSALFAPFTFVCFTLALATDILYWRSEMLMWQNFSSWLLLTGEVFGGLAILFGIIDFMRPSTRPWRPSFAAAGVFVCVLILAFVNSLVHAGDGWTAVVPMGLTISAATFVLLLITLWLSIAHARSALYTYCAAYAVTQSTTSTIGRVS